MKICKKNENFFQEYNNVRKQIHQLYSKVQEYEFIYLI